MLIDVSSWWHSMESFEQIFWFIALLFSLLFLGQTIFSFVSGDTHSPDGDPDADVHADHGIGFQFFTIKNFIAFFTMFGWAGISGVRAGWSPFMTVVGATIAGVAIVALMVFLLKKAADLKESGNMQIRNAINKIGETYLFIPANRKGTGKIQVKIQGSLHELQAMTDDLQDIPTGSVVRVTDVIADNLLLVTTQLA